MEIARQGGIASGIARREKKTIQKILGDFLDLDITENKKLEALAKKLEYQRTEILNNQVYKKVYILSYLFAF